MTDRPILFSGPMVNALLEGRSNRHRIYQSEGRSPTSPEHLARRLANALDEADDSHCWEWQRTKNNKGYGTLTVQGKTRYAHRLAFELSGRDIPTGLEVMHSCDNPSCINPDHLEAGTRSKNMADCYSRGRSKIPVVRMYGEKNGASKLTNSDVLNIRYSLDAGSVQRIIAEKFNVSQALISRIKRGEIWNG